jgi:hypothetical protein
MANRHEWRISPQNGLKLPEGRDLENGIINFKTKLC